MGLVERQLVSVDWDVRTVRVVSFTMRSKSGVRVKRVMSVAIPAEADPGDPAVIGRLLRQALDREGIRATRMVVDVPRDQAVLNTLSLPTVAEDDLPAMVEFQIAKELPFPLADAITDFAVPEDPGESGRQDVLVAAVRHEVLDYYRQTAEVAGLKLERIGLRPYANKVAVSELLGPAQHERVLFVDVGPALTEIDVIRDGRLAFSRAASVVVPEPSSAEPPPPPSSPSGGNILDLNGGGLTLSPGEAAPAELSPVVQSLLREVALTIEAYRAGDPGADMSHVVVGGDTGVEDDLLEAIRQRFAIGGERYNPTANFGWNAESGSAAGGFAAVLGLALGHAAEGRLHFDFLHPKKAVPQAQRQLRKAPMVAVVALVFIAAGTVTYTRTILPKKNEIAQLKSEINDAKSTLKERKKFGEMIKKVDQFESDQVVWLDALVELISVWPDPDEIVLKQLDVSQKERRIDLKMECADSSIAEEARKRLEELGNPEDGKPRFEATLGATRDNNRQDEYKVDTSMTITVFPPA
ncbi:MAG: pilus assembly protein PilM [bacterium]|nr:pilus assembly protein PilM [bacterium]